MTAFIIPNWHPFLVHFTLVLVYATALLFLIKWILPKLYHQLVTPKLEQLLMVLLPLSAIATVGAGYHAYNTVNHDSVSHLAMLSHKSWALTTLGVIILASVTYFLLPKFRDKLAGMGVLLAMVLVSVTGYKGAELVYRYGLGVMSLPEISEDAHDDGHDHAHGGSRQSSEPSEEIVMTDDMDTMMFSDEEMAEIDATLGDFENPNQAFEDEEHLEQDNHPHNDDTPHSH